MIENYLKFITNRRLTQIGLIEQFPGIENPFPWMSEIVNLRKEKHCLDTGYRVSGRRRLVMGLISGGKFPRHESPDPAWAFLWVNRRIYPT